MKLRNDSTWHLVHNSQRLLDNMVPKHHKAKKKADIRLFPQFEYKKKNKKESGKCWDIISLVLVHRYFPRLVLYII